MSKSKFSDVLNKLKIDETFSKRIQTKPKEGFNKVKDNIPLIANYNFMADLLHLPTAKLGYKYLLVVVDLATNKFDIEPMKDKEADTTLKALKKCFLRDYIKLPYSSLKTDGGTEFKGVFHKYLYDHDILHKVGLADRHKSLANVESLNRQLSRLIMGYLNTKDKERQNISTDWLPTIPILRKELNKIREIKLPDDITTHQYPVFDNETKTKTKTSTKILIQPKFKIGDTVHRALDAPRTALGKKQNTKNFRSGDITFDTTPNTIEKIIYMGGKGPNYRYMLSGIHNASYTENELMKV